MADKIKSDTVKKDTDEIKSSGAKTSRSRTKATADGVAKPKSTAKSTARKVAAAVSETVKEIKEKVTRSAATKTKSATSARAKTAATKSSSTAKSTSTENAGRAETTSKPRPTKAATARTPSKRTKTAALAEGTTSEDVRLAIQDAANSEDVPAESLTEVPAATDVKEHFFEEQRLQDGPPPPQPARDLPDEYGDTKLVLLVRDPEWIYAYWEVNDAARDQFGMPRNGNHNSRLVLRIYKITDTSWPDQSAHYFFDVEVPKDARNWYLHMPEANEQWCAELGLIDHEDNYTAVCRSNRVITPRNTISDRIDSEWMTVEESFEKITRLSRASLEAQLRGDASAASSEAILRTINRQLTAVLHGEKAALSSGIFSSESALPQREKGFWLQVHTELLLYGATEPDAQVTVQGRSIELNEDGTFSMRFALPDGLQILEVNAVNADGDLEESVTPVVERSTR